MSRFVLTKPMPRLLLAAAAALLPLLSIWNLSVGPDRAIQIGPKLGGVTNELPLNLSWPSVEGGSFQKGVASRVVEAFPFRRLLIRINNEVRFELFGAMTAPQVISGAKGHLFERIYIDDYCSRVEGTGAAVARDMAPKLKAVQDYYRERGAIFLYLLSPSKAAHLPEHFLSRVSCPSSPAARAQLVPQYVGALRDAGIHVLDAASLIHGLKGRYEVDLFPQGGVHWNDLGGAIVVSALVKEINALAGRELVPPFSYSYTLSKPGSGADRELADLLNVFFPPLGYLTPKVDFIQSATCDRTVSHSLDAAIVGTSFSHLPASILIQHNCLSALNVYYYATLGRFGGVPYRELQRNLQGADFDGWRGAKIMILEENESILGKGSSVDFMLQVLGRK